MLDKLLPLYFASIAFLIAISLITLTHLLLSLLTSPLAHLPGPWHTAFTDLYLVLQEFRGNRRPYIHRLHEEYGPVVRLGRSEVAFSSGDAVREIYSSNGSGYDKTELYDLFMQFGRRTMFSTLGKEEVRLGWIEAPLAPWWEGDNTHTEADGCG